MVLPADMCTSTLPEIESLTRTPHGLCKTLLTLSIASTRAASPDHPRANHSGTGAAVSISCIRTAWHIQIHKVNQPPRAKDQISHVGSDSVDEGLLFLGISRTLACSFVRRGRWVPTALIDKSRRYRTRSTEAQTAEGPRDRLSQELHSVNRE